MTPLIDSMRRLHYENVKGTLATGQRMGYPEYFNGLEQWRDELRRSLAGEGTLRAIEARIAEESDPDRLEILDHLLVQEHLARGNRAEADAIRARRSDLEILRWRDDWHESHLEADIVTALEERIRDEADPRRLQTLRWLLAREQRDRGNYLAAEAVQLADAGANPDNARPLIALATQKLYDENLPDEAMGIIERAIAAAMRSGLFRREALGVKARVALELADYRAVEDSLRQIMALAMTRGHIDIGAERDFFDRLPPSSIDPEVAHAYDEYCRARGRRRTASAEQIDAFVLAAVRPKWLKVARIIGDVLKACERDDVANRDFFIARRIAALVAAGRLEAQGNLAKWHFSEVRLAELSAGADADGQGAPPPEPAITEREVSPIVAGRILTMKVGRRDVEVPVTIYAPVNKGDHWRCDFAIGWPDKARHGYGNGIDSAQALLIALRFVGVELYTSTAHKAGKLKCPGQRAGYGFPLPWTIRDEAQGEDRFL